MRGWRRVRGHGGAALILMLMLLPWRVSLSVIHSAPVDSLLALSTTHGWWQAARFLLLPAQPPVCDEQQPRRRRCRRRYHHRSLTASAPASVCRCLCLHPRRQLPSAHVPPSPPPTSPTHPPPARHLAAAAARTRSCRRTLLLTCRAVIVVAPVSSSPHPQSLSARSSECACS